jgi:Pectinacetylesterase
MTLPRTLTRSLIALALWLPAGWAAAAYYVWETVTLPASTGAACGNGTPYRFFVNRALFTSDMTITFEGGGACWDQEACEGKGDYSASNPDGIPANYMSLPNAAAGGLVTPFSARLDPFQGVQTQGDNLVYMPYCTGDVHTGSATVVYDDADPRNPRVQYHQGKANIEAAADWLKKHLGRPDRLVLTGFSAGGVGATANYAIARDILQPRGRATLLADSGPLFNAPRGSTKEAHPSLPLHEKIRATWGLDGPQGLVTQLATKLPALDINNMGSLNTALAAKYTKDRFGIMLFQEDGIFSAFSYLDFFPDIAGDPDPKRRADRINALWRQDIAQSLPPLDAQPNISYHIPFYRNFNEAHCLTIVDFSGTGIEEAGIADLTPFIDKNLDRKAVLRTVEQDQVSDLSRPVSLAMTILAIVLEFFS